MAVSRPAKYWTLVTILLVAIIVVGGVIIQFKYSPSRPVDISMPPSQELIGGIYIDGAVSIPGFYPLNVDDGVEALVQAAGGPTDYADLNQLKLYIPELGEEEPPQKINLNRAEAWLLEALPGIGETLAQCIIDYRQQSGPFNNINELTKVEGIGTATYEKIKHLITVAD